MNDNEPCTSTGHDYSRTGRIEYHPHGMPRPSGLDYFTITKQTQYECTKCEDVRYDRELISKVTIDFETEQITQEFVEDESEVRYEHRPNLDPSNLEP